jgi:alkaline phosphatase
MRKLAALFGIVAFSGVAHAATVNIAPVSGAKFLAGANFDFRVEVTGLKGTPRDVTVTVNGQAADAYFRKPLVTSSLAPDNQNLMVRGVALRTTGKLEVIARGVDDAGVFVKQATYEVVREQNFGKRAKNVIIFIGDGMGWNTVTNARIVMHGIENGKARDQLNMEKAEAVATVATSGLSGLVTDSANSASAYSTGHKTANNAMGVYPDNTPDTLDDPRQENLFEILKRTRPGVGFGLVTTSYLADATPAAWVAHTRRRADYSEIVGQFFDSPARPSVIMGGGSIDFLPKSTKGSRRKDERDLIKEFQGAGYQFVSSAKELSAAKPEKVLGLFQLQWMNAYLDRVQFKNPDVLGTFTDQPLLWDMTTKAIASLEALHPDGFVLMVEGSNSDVLQHALDWQRATWDAIEMDMAVGKAKEWAAQRGDTLVIATADHAHTNSTYGTYSSAKGAGAPTGTATGVGLYEDFGFPTYQNNRDANGLPMARTDVGLAVGYGAAPAHYATNIAQDKPNVPTVVQDGKNVPNPAYAGGQLAGGNIGGTSGNHSVDPVPLFASGPGSQFFIGSLDNTEVFFRMARALGVDATRTATTTR